MNITVYLGALRGNDPVLKDAVKELGTWIGENNHTLIYGGSKSVIGIEPQFFIDEELQYDGLTELIITKDMTERKTKMIELGDAFIAFPGGTGTLEEISEVMSKISLKQLHAPCIFYNLNDYYKGMKELMSHMIEMGLSTHEKQKGIYFADHLDDIRNIIEKE